MKVVDAREAVRRTLGVVYGDDNDLEVELVTPHFMEEHSVDFSYIAYKDEIETFQRTIMGMVEE